uniref:Lipocalin/cytosolic fatty-acid binding domain-containing protein n=1 Tax=Balaenoptera musculus TaxID=9771 RepID=A0A8C0D378_BALMU
MNNCFVCVTLKVSISRQNFVFYCFFLRTTFLSTRNLSCLAKPTVPISTNEDEITVKTKSIFQINENSFKMREEFEETILGGQKTKNTVTLDNDSLIQVQDWAGRETPRRRKLVDGKMAMETCVISGSLKSRHQDKTKGT